MKNSPKKLIKAMFLVGAMLLASLVFGFATPSSASASESCSGALIYHQALGASGKTGSTIAYIDVFYSSANGGTNTACLNKSGDLYAVKSKTEITIQRCGSYYRCPSTVRGEPRQSDAGQFSYYAGPVSVTGTRSRCVQVWGSVVNRGRTIYYYADNIGCGATPYFAAGI